jgi:hypothetical protein
MDNLSPKWKFTPPSNEKPSLRPFYQHTWPKDLPTECQICGTAFRTGFNLQIGPNRIGRLLKKAAYISFLPCLALPFFAISFFPYVFYGLRGNHGWWLFFAIMFLPPLTMLLLSLFTPIVRHVECKKCGWSRDYPGMKASGKKREQESI